MRTLDDSPLSKLGRATLEKECGEVKSAIQEALNPDRTSPVRDLQKAKEILERLIRSMEVKKG